MSARPIGATPPTDRPTLLEAVAHRAWHLLDEGGEQDDDPGTFEAAMSDAAKLSDALDALEADGWEVPCQ